MFRKAVSTIEGQVLVIISVERFPYNDIQGESRFSIFISTPHQLDRPLHSFTLELHPLSTLVS